MMQTQHTKQMMEVDEKTLSEEFSHAQGTIYLDHAGATLYSKTQLEAHFKDLTTHLYGNPHSPNPSSLLATEAVDNVREIVLRHFNTDSSQYDVIFTSGCTAALKLLAESFPWSGKERRFDNGRTKRVEITSRQSGLAGSASILLQVESDVHYLPGLIHPMVETNDKGSPLVSNVIDSNTSVFCYLEDNHTSVIGMRELAGLHGATLVCATENDVQHPNCTLKHCNGTPNNVASESDSPYHLFAYPAQSNFSGRKYPLNWSNDIPNGTLKINGLHSLTGSWKVVLDAASYASTCPLDLSMFQPHFVTLSFYKMFGYPTGLGALLVRKDCGDLLRYKEFYGGGTVLATVSRSGFRIPRPQVNERLEDGTLPFLDIIALRHGFKALTTIGRSIENISQHTFHLANYVYNSLSSMEHSNGHKACIIYSDTDYTDPSTQGPIISFNMLRSNGQFVGYGEVEKLATLHGIHLRTGCFCNTGACMKHLGLSEERVRLNVEAGHVCGDSVDLIDGVPTGAVRISFGYMSTLRDVKEFVQFIETCFVEKTTSSSTKHTTSEALSPLPTTIEQVSDSFLVTTHPGQPENTVREEGSASTREEAKYPLLRVGDTLEAILEDGSSVEAGVLQSISLYPVKGCAAFSVTSWPVGAKGLLYDREWMVLNEHGSVMRQKQVGRLCLVRPSVDLEAGKLVLQAEGFPPFELCLNEDSRRDKQSRNNPLSHSTRISGDKVQSTDCGDDVAEWLRNILGRDCHLVRQNPKIRRISRTSKIPLSLTNLGQYLLISLSSVEKLHSVITKNSGCHGDGCPGDEVLSLNQLVARFRGNLIIGGSQLEPNAEEKWKMVHIGELEFDVMEGCSRCQVICVDQDTGTKTMEPLKTLMAQQGSMPQFGIYLTLKT